MNPSPEAVAVCGALAMIPAIEEHVDPDFLVTVVHDSLSPYRERVRRLVRIATIASERLANLGVASMPMSLSCYESNQEKRAIEDELDAALAPFLEQETVTP